MGNTSTSLTIGAALIAGILAYSWIASGWTPAPPAAAVNAPAEKTSDYVNLVRLNARF